MKIGIIGGSGLYEMEGLTRLEEHALATPFGAPSDAYISGVLHGREVIFLPRHGKGHRFLPSEIPFRANVWGMKKLGVTHLLSVSAVGSLKEEVARERGRWLDSWVGVGDDCAETGHQQQRQRQVQRRSPAGEVDRDAETELFRRMAPRIRLYGLRHLRDVHAADDLTQQVLITTLVALRAGRLREPDKLASFVLGTCRMTVLELQRGARRRARLLSESGVDLLAPPPASMPELDVEQLTRCVQSLKERERTVVVLTFYDEQTGADVAKLLGVSEQNVRVIRHRAIQKLRECMGAVA